MTSVVVLFLLISQLAGGAVAPAPDGGTKVPPLRVDTNGGTEVPPLQVDAAKASARIDALRLIDRAGDRSAIDAVARLVRDPEDEVQLVAIDTLLNLLLAEKISDQRKVAFVIELRRSTGPQGAYDAGMRPAHEVTPAVFEALAAALGDLNLEVRFNAAYATAVLAHTDTVREMPTRARLALASGLATMLMTGEPQLRLAAARAAARVFGAPPETPALEVEPLPQALGDALIVLMNQPTAEEQIAAMEAVGLAREVRGLQAISERFTYFHKKKRHALARAALQAIARIAHPSSRELVAALEGDKWASRDEQTAATVAFARERLLQ